MLTLPGNLFYKAAWIFSHLWRTQASRVDEFPPPFPFRELPCEDFLFAVFVVFWDRERVCCMSSFPGRPFFFAGGKPVLPSCELTFFKVFLGEFFFLRAGTMILLRGEEPLFFLLA